MTAKKLEIRLGHWIWKKGGIGVDLRLAYLLLWQGRPAGSWIMPAGVWGWDKAMSEGKEDWRRTPMQFFSGEHLKGREGYNRCSAKQENETRGLDFERQKEM